LVFLDLRFLSPPESDSDDELDSAELDSEELELDEPEELDELSSLLEFFSKILESY